MPRHVSGPLCPGHQFAHRLRRVPGSAVANRARTERSLVAQSVASHRVGRRVAVRRIRRLGLILGWRIERGLIVALGRFALTNRRRCQVNWLSICLPRGAAVRFDILMKIGLAIWRVRCAVVRHVAASAMKRIAGPIARRSWPVSRRGTP